MEVSVDEHILAPLSEGMVWRPEQRYWGKQQDRKMQRHQASVWQLISKEEQLMTATKVHPLIDSVSKPTCCFMSHLSCALTGQDLQEMQHLQAVGALRSVGGSIKMKVLRERLVVPGHQKLREATPAEVDTVMKRQQAEAQNSGQPCPMQRPPDPTPDRLSPADKIEVVCNSKRLSTFLFRYLASF
ncbi:hypothetical protein P4O66_013416 [Electrophorus voltai]|uniref:Uncharacterized protein n=1 Tax=Electrophorus voltai TaxID=2609070 RepID=A0AAD8Z1U2_9TELE|nr:hypothetical protein P4O66_013416 [Electrophorus voltai]